MRARLAVLSRLYPDELDAAISAWPQKHGDLRELRPLMPPGRPLTFRAFGAHKDLVDAGGRGRCGRFSVPAGCAARRRLA